MKIPFLNLQRQQKELLQPVQKLLTETMLEDILLGGKAVHTFEDKFARYLNVKHVIACANCTDALEIALRALQIGQGDEVIVPANGWMSAAEAVCLLGAVPVFVDSLVDRYTIDPDKIETKITSRTKAIIPIHLYGYAADMERIMGIAAAYGLKVIEDCAQAQGATIQGKKAGSWGDIAAFSFYPTKNLGAIGDAGALATNDEELSTTCRQIANHGQSEKNIHVRLGRNSRMDSFQAAVLSYKLGLLDQWNLRRRELAQRYNNELQPYYLHLPQEDEGYFHVYHLYVIRCADRKRLSKLLGEKGVGTAVHYPVAVADMQVFEAYSFADTPVASKQCHELLSLPLYPQLTDEEQMYIIEAMKEALSEMDQQIV